MSVARKLQIKPGQGVVVLGRPADVDLDLNPDDLVEDYACADAALVFVTSTEDLATPDLEVILDAARRGVLAWVAYPKAGQLDTDLSRDSVAVRLSERGVRPVRQISVDDTWSALRFRPAG
jgi:hypothetical protein